MSVNSNNFQIAKTFLRSPKNKGLEKIKKEKEEKKIFFQPGLNNSSSIRMKRYSNFSKIISHQSVNEETDARRKQDPP